MHELLPAPALCEEKVKENYAVLKKPLLLAKAYTVSNRKIKLLVHVAPVKQQECTSGTTRRQCLLKMLNKGKSHFQASMKPIAQRLAQCSQNIKVCILENKVRGQFLNDPLHKQTLQWTYHGEKAFMTLLVRNQLLPIHSLLGKEVREKKIEKGIEGTWTSWHLQQ